MWYDQASTRMEQVTGMNRLLSHYNFICYGLAEGDVFLMGGRGWERTGLHVFVYRVIRQ